VAFWLILTLAGIASASSATKALSDQYSVPGREGYDTNALITRTFGNGGNSPPLLAVVTLPNATNVESTAVRAGLDTVASKIQQGGHRPASRSGSAPPTNLRCDPESI
jgi:RND superfamily putative drug exporter